MLLALMFSAGVGSASVGYTLGRKALRGITQPDMRPTNNLGATQGTTARSDKLVFLKEQDIITNVKKRMAGGGEPDAKPKSESNNQPAADSTPTPPPGTPVKFPIKGQDQKVTLEVSAVRKRGSSLLLDISLKNEGSQSVRFLYSFLNVTDDQGRALSATTEYLPEELPANSNPYYGTVSIPTSLLDNAKTISLVLTDYPDQKLQLQLSGIPVAQN